MNIRWPGACAAIFAVAVTAGSAQQSPGYARQVSPGAVRLELTPEWQDSALVVLIQAETQSGELAVINLKEQVRLAVDRQVYSPDAASTMRGRRAVAWVLFRLPQKPQQFAISIWKVPDSDLRILRWPVALTPEDAAPRP